jgi:hypothetical protein
MKSICIRDDQTDELFYVFPDKKQLNQPLPKTVDDAYGDGYLTILSHSNGMYYLNIANEEYSGSYQELTSILCDWALSEGYEF